MAIRILFVNDYSIAGTLASVAREGDNSAHLWGYDYLAKHEETAFTKTNARLLSWQKKTHLDALFGGIYEEMSVLSRRKNTDVIVAANINLVWGLGYLKRIMKIPPVIAILHSLPAYDHWLYKAFMRNHLNGIDRILCIAKKDHLYLLSVLGLNPERVQYVPWAVNPNDFDLSPKDRPADHSSLRRFIVSIGKTKRDYATLIRAFRATGLSDLDLRIFGSGPGLKESLGAENITVNENRVYFKECVKQYRSSEFVVVPLVGSQRTLGLTSLFDAMAVGKAVIMTKNPGVDIDIEKEKIGLWVEPENSEDLKEKILHFSKHPDLAAEYGANGRKYLEERYHYGKFCEELHRVVREVYKVR